MVEKAFAVVVYAKDKRTAFSGDLFGLDWTRFEDRSSPVLWKPDLDPGAP